MKKKRPTRAEIAAWCGIFKVKPGEKSVVEESQEDRREDLRREEAKWQRLYGKSVAVKRRSR